MNELTYYLAILVQKKVLTPLEAKKLQGAAKEAVISSSLPEMMAKVDRALKVKDDMIEKVDARDFLAQ